MILTLKNIGKIKEAKVEIKGITVIAGANDTGKRTVGKALFSIFNSFYQIEKKIKKERLQSIEKVLKLIFRNSRQPSLFDYKYNFKDMAKEFVENIEIYKNANDKIKYKIMEYYQNNDFKNKKMIIDDDKLNELIERLNATLLVSDTDIIKSDMEKKINAEFNSQVNNIFSNEKGEIKLIIQDEAMIVTISNNLVINIENTVNLQTEAIYMDDPFIIDEINEQNNFNRLDDDHRSHLKSKLSNRNIDINLVDEIVTKNKFSKIYNKLSSVCGGDVVKTKSNVTGYKKAGSDKILDIRNLSTGLKTFVILKKLLTNGVLDYNGTIILDEPEIHLHPEWQLLFAELIVLIQKEFGMHILLNTHSPYFLDAIDVYSNKYNISDKCKYYLAYNENEFSYIEDVTNNLEVIYDKLAKPLQNLENERYSND